MPQAQSVRAILKCLAGASALLVGLAAGSATAQTVLRIDEVPPGEIDPARVAKYIDAILLYNAYDTLLRPGPGGEGVVPHLAAGYKVEGKVVTFALRPDVTFESGNPLTSADVVFSVNRLLAIGSGFSPLFRGWIAKTEAVDPQTVRITLADNYAPFLSSLFRLGIVDSKTVMANLKDGSFGEFKDYGQAYLNTRSAGTGAYRVVSHGPTSTTVMEKNPRHFLGVPPAAPDQVRVSYGLEGATETALMRRGELDVISQWASPETKRTASSIPGVQVLGEGGIAKFLMMLNTKRPPLDDVHCRLALAYAVDYQSLVSLVNISPRILGAKTANGPLLEGMIGYDPTMKPVVQDLERAKAELAQCKYKPGDNELEISWIGEVPVEERFGLLLQSNWAELGFKSKIVRYPFASYVQVATKPETTPHLSQLSFNARTTDPDSVLYALYNSKAVGTYTGPTWLQNPEIDALLDKGRSTLEPEARAAIYRDLAKRIVDLGITIHAYDAINTFPRSQRVSIPLLEDPARNTKIYGLNYTFRDMIMK